MKKTVDFGGSIHFAFQTQQLLWQNSFGGNFLLVVFAVFEHSQFTNVL